jgi:hypothetical protein
MWQPTPLVAAEADRLEESRIEALELRAELSATGPSFDHA